MISYKNLSNRKPKVAGAGSNRCLFIVMVALATFACATTADPDSERAVSTPLQVAQADAVDEKLLRRGKILFLQCRACHSTEPDGAHRVGPNLHALFGAGAASKPGFAYSAALSDSGITWSADTLNQFLTEPSAFVPGTIMAFAGLPQESDRKALIAYLEQQTR